jgi:hypothetical protein
MEFKNQIKAYLEDNGFIIRTSFDKRNNGCWNISVLNQTKFYNFIYLNSNIAMHRKKHLLGQLIGDN